MHDRLVYFNSFYLFLMNLSRQRTFMTFHIKNMSITEQQDVVNFSSLKEFRSFTFATE